MPHGAPDMLFSMADTACCEATLTAFSSFLANFEIFGFSGFLEAKKHFFLESAQKMVRPQSDKNHFFFFFLRPLEMLKTLRKIFKIC